MQRQPINSRRRLALVATVVAALFLLPPAAQAAVVSSDGTTANFEGTDAPESVIVDVEFSGEISISGEGVVAGAGCSQGLNTANCPNGAGGLEMRLGGGDDVVTSIVTSPSPASFRVDLGDGNDSFSGQENVDAVLGGPGNDKVVSRGGADSVDGGPGNDTLEAGDGTDRVLGGEGDDSISADSTGNRSADVIDGGPGTDALDDYYTGLDPATAPQVKVTLAGGADDGLPGENDDVRGIERLRAQAALDFTGDEGANEAVAAEVGGPSRLSGLGGDDALTATDSNDSLDGGPGNDTLTGGFGSDTIVGGPGSDTIDADRAARCNEMHCDISPGTSNDTIEARDGTPDKIACGPGADRVEADAADVVAADCETVERAGGAPGGAKPKLALDRRVRLGAALAKGVRVRVTGAAPGTLVKLTGSAGKRVLARGQARAGNGGAATVTLRFTAAAARSLRHARRLVLTVTGSGARAVLTLHR